MRTATAPAPAAWGRPAKDHPHPKPTAEIFASRAALTTWVAGTSPEEGPSEALGLPPCPRTCLPVSLPQPWSTGLMQATWHTARPQTRRFCVHRPVQKADGPVHLTWVPKVARGLQHCRCSAPHLSRSGDFIIPRVRTGLGGCVRGPGEPGSDRATCVMQWPGPLAGASALDTPPSSSERRDVPRGLGSSAGPALSASHPARPL